MLLFISLIQVAHQRLVRIDLYRLAVGAQLRDRAEINPCGPVLPFVWS
jgi:hypothetical protein